jgi:hypothetical protein
MTRRLLAPVLAAVLALAACSSNTPPASTAAPATSAAAAPSSAASAATPASCPNGRLPSGACAGDPSAPAPGLYNDRVAWEVCPAILRASSADRKNPDVMEPLGEKASASQDVGMSNNGKLLVDESRLARAAKGTGNEAKIVTSLAGVAEGLATTCSKAGFKA